MVSKEYIIAKIKSIDGLIERSHSLEETDAYRKFREFWSEQLPEVMKKRIATKDPTIYFDMGSEGDIRFVDPPLPVKKSITEVIEESQVETLEGIKEVLEEHKDVINGNKVRCPECNEMFSKGAGFAAHYRAKHLE